MIGIAHCVIAVREEGSAPIVSRVASYNGEPSNQPLLEKDLNVLQQHGRTEQTSRTKAAHQPYRVTVQIMTAAAAKAV